MSNFEFSINIWQRFKNLDGIYIFKRGNNVISWIILISYHMLYIETPQTMHSIKLEARDDVTIVFEVYPADFAKANIPPNL